MEGCEDRSLKNFTARPLKSHIESAVCSVVNKNDKKGNCKADVIESL